MLATAFISDFIYLALSLDWARPILATTADGMAETSFPSDAFTPGISAVTIPRWLQPAGDLGAKLEGIMRQGLVEAPCVLCCGADSPGRPRERFEAARRALLEEGADAVLGPTEDGGYDIIGVRSCPPGLLAGLPWSQPTTFAASKQRLEERGFRVAILDLWWDVDEVEDLQRLHALLAEARGSERAPATAAVMGGLDGGGVGLPAQGTDGGGS